MKNIQIALVVFVFSSFTLNAQTNVRAWYADGQVWVVWNVQEPLPETYAIYAKPSSFTNTADATLVGRLFDIEYGAGALKEQVDTGLTFRIPNGQGGFYQLAGNEGLFVMTPHQAGSLWFAVVAWGETEVNSGVNITSAAVSFGYNPVADPVECHLQATFPSPFAAGYTCFAFYMWADGRQNQWENRPDFPVTANAAKNGMPGFFMISVPAGIDTSQPFPLTVWLHGGEGIARQSLAGSRSIVNLKPEEGILLAHNDDLVGYRGLGLPNIDNPSWHFGWRKNYDPFTSDNLPTVVDTVVNYTQRRYIWIDQWLIRRFNVDPTRININGHSMGSAGTTALAKVYPNHYATATIFNNGFGGPVNNTSFVVFGPTDLNFPTNLSKRNGEAVGFADVFNIIDNCSPERDLPLFRSYCGKNDFNDAMMWDAFVVENYRKADSLAQGMQLMWSERTHDIGGIGDHWAFGDGPLQQTNIEDVLYEETHFRSDVSFPAFFNHRLNPANGTPGDGTPGTGATGVGNDWGAWGGYHRWDWNNITDMPGIWSVDAWLESNAVFVNDNCPLSQLSSSMAIRKPQQFKPITGRILNWSITDLSTGNILQSGTTSVLEDDLVVIPQVVVYPEDARRVRISLVDPMVVGITEETNAASAISISPNPSSGGQTNLHITMKNSAEAEIQAIAINGHGLTFKTQLHAGKNEISLNDFESLPKGFYFIVLRTSSGQRICTKWLKG